jgi:hypothetical protein
MYYSFKKDYYFYYYYYYYYYHYHRHRCYDSVLGIKFLYRLFFSVAQQHNLGLGHHIIEVSRSHTVKYVHPLSFLRRCDQLVVEVSNYTIHNIHVLSGIRTP